ncbi:MAG: PAS domain-containing protein [Deltaproteobacteria bacterium]|nr:PAS domain-containing protein [Deltaproteobacteria bacterium]
MSPSDLPPDHVMENQAPAAAASATQPEAPSAAAEEAGPPPSELRGVVGLGASAGGLASLQQLAPRLPAGMGLAYVVVQHLDPGRESRLAKLLAEAAELPVVPLISGQVLAPDHIYINPAGQNPEVKEDRVELTPAPAGSAPRPSVDQFFCSLAESWGERAAGVILSGTGQDGALGLRALKALGGVTMVQDPGTAQFDGMIQAALRQGVVDLVRPPREMGPELARLFNPNLEEACPAPEGSELDHLCDAMLRRSGADFSQYKPGTLRRRLGRRLALRRLRSVAEYLVYLESHPEELDALVKDILISVTSFFRDPPAFQVLNELVIPRILGAKKAGDPIRVWVPACATGEEAYSLAMLFAARLREQPGRHELQVFGTDLDGEAIRHARRGVYPAASLAGVDPGLREAFFRREEEAFRVVKELRERLVFAKHDLTRDPPFPRLDLISCRNLLIYFNSELHRRLMPLFHFALLPGGYLFLGKSESVGREREIFEPVDHPSRIYRRKGGRRVQPPARLSHYRRELAEIGARPSGGPPPSLAEMLHGAVALTLGHAAVLADRQGEIVFVQGDAGKFIRLQEGPAKLNLVDLARPDLRTYLRAALSKAAREELPVASRRIRLDDGVLLNLHVRPAGRRSGGGDLFMVLFEELAGREEAAAPAPPGDESGRNRDLEEELAVVRDHLRMATLELDSRHEELQALNEEMQAANEELQATNEELETGNEELQATNEELTTVNEELQIKTAELQAAYSDLENILKRLGLAMVVVDENLRVRRFTPAAANIFHLMPGDRGQTLDHPGATLELPYLRQDLAEVMDSGRGRQRLVEAGANYFDFRLYPFYDQEERIKGAILTLIDITEVHRRQQEFRALAENAPDIVARLDRRHRFLYMNRVVERYVARSREAYLNKTPRELNFPPELCRQWEESMDQLFESGRETRNNFALETTVGLRHFEARMNPEFGPDGRLGSLLVVCRDVTRQKEDEETIRTAARQMHDILGSITDGFFTLDHQFRVTFFNQAAGRLLGREPEEVLGQNLFEAFPEIRGSIFEEKFTEALVERRSLAFETYFAVEPYVNWYDMRIYPREQGLSVYFLVTTEQKRAVEALAKGQERMRELLRDLPAGVLVRGPDARVVYCNQAAQRILGLGEAEILGHSADDIPVFMVDEEGRRLPRAAYPVKRVLATGQPLYDQVLGAEKPGGEISWALVNVVPLVEDGQVVQVVTSFVDLTARKKAEAEKISLEGMLRQAQKMEALGTMAGGIAHDFNNILAAVMGYTELALQMSREGRRVDTELRRILAASGRARELVRQILLFSRRSETQLTPLDLNRQVTQAAAILERALAKMISLELKLGRDLPLIRADAGQIEQVLLNLAANAADAMPGGGRLTMETRVAQIGPDDRELAPGEYLCLVVTDTGVGIAQENLGQIFDPFFTTKEVGRGTGLGLSVVHGIIKSHGGHITCQSRLGQGTSFIIHLPAADDDPAPSPRLRVARPEAAGRGELILLVDDEDSLLDMGSQTLILKGYQVLTARRGEEALQVLAERGDEIGLTVLDLNMPGMGGENCLRVIHERHPQAKVVVASGYAQQVKAADILALGARAFLEKPYRQAELLETIRRVLDS